MTSTQNKSGTERCLEAAIKQGLQNSKEPVVIVNIQGDEPFIDPGQIDKVCNIFYKDERASIATLIKPISNKEELLDPNTVKCVINNNKKAIYFSRSPIPYVRNSCDNNCLEQHQYFKHIGIYAYKLGVLKEINSLRETLLEKAESLEQLRWIENGYSITVEITDIESFSVDTPKDIENLMKKIYR
jgi:3-deoxy-manno-octulosonate cytidylyltransferase (CMP-KDO synthetase)